VSHKQDQDRYQASSSPDRPAPANPEAQREAITNYVDHMLAQVAAGLRQQSNALARLAPKQGVAADSREANRG
jgi:hypothetical protein